jgi:serine/threonine protein kinase
VVDVKPNDVTLTATYNMKSASQPPRPTPACVGRYQLGEVLGAGAMGVVYRAHDPDLERVVAIKLVRTGAVSSGTRLLREAQAMARLRHPNVVPIFDVGPAEDAVFVVMPLIEGSTLRRWLQDGAHTFHEILDRFCAAGRGLAAAHAAGLVHRDFKPDNVLLGRDGETQVSDFGLACLANEEVTPVSSASTLASGALTQTGDILGTPPYMAPEQLHGRPSDARADQFSFCVALWEGIYGARPFADPPSDTDNPLRARLLAIAAGPVPPAPQRDRPAWIAPVLARGLATDPDHRWPTMDALLDAIAAQRTPRRWPWRLAIAIVAAVLTLAIALWSRFSLPAPSSLGLVQLTRYDNLANAAISPDGTKLAIVAGDSLVLRGIEDGAEERVLVEHGISDWSLSWSPDSKHLLVDIIPEVVDTIQTELVDVDRGPQYKLPSIGFSSFLSNDEVAVTSYRQRSIKIFPLGEHAAPVAECEVPGNYTFIWSLAGMPDGTMIVNTRTAETNTLVIIGRDCRVRAKFPSANDKETIAGVALSDAGTVVTLVPKDGHGEILELSLDGTVLSRRQVSGEFERVIGRRHGADYVLALDLRTHLDRVPITSSRHELSVHGLATFSIAPNDGMLAWIELGGKFRPRVPNHGATGPLRLSTLQGLARRGNPLLNNAVSVGWSLDGQWLAVLVDNDDGAAIEIIDRTGSPTRRWRRPELRNFDPTAHPVWLGDHRIATRTADLTTYRWYDLETGAQGDLTDRTHGSVYWLTRSPRDGTLAMWRIGKAGAINAHTEHLWLVPPGREATPLHVEDATRYHLLPSWSPSGELLVRALETGVVSQVDLATGELTKVAQLPPMFLGTSNDEHLLPLPGGDLLAVETEPGMNVSVVRPDDGRPRRSLGERNHGAM